MFPLFSILRREPDFAQPPQQFVLLHLKRAHLMEWVRAVIAATLGIGRGQDLPPIIMQEETDSIWTQIRGLLIIFSTIRLQDCNPNYLMYAASRLEGYGPHEWVCFERALVVRDIFTGGVRTFLDSEDAQLFRDNMYSNYGQSFVQAHLTAWRF